MTDEWLKAIPDEALKRIDHGEHFAADFRRNIDDEMWRRFSDKLREWPTHRGNLGDLELVGFCLKATSPDDPEHRPVACRGDTLQCSCGHRSEPPRTWRVPGPFWWPVETIDGLAHYVVCPRVRCVDDLEHAPSSELSRQDHAGPILFCICHCQYERDPDGLYAAAKLMPAQ